ncbi:type II toxin-antitoxin system RelE/ParE family toxin [Pseudomonas sp. zfem002]|uniref:type II toxin-antitoxin system RelE/ParE family toxin n=1 Tax=Pseudomonas sp. zfem002 TaxID=3078197 RepID=UPI0029276B5D|nr:type II toxin-antitoxin system RelE/ParE family toxin [Pseudomonas sp. zfem002]MDU9391818.1 type II toxin-antitoxin system RelE/ParE family toxin [Pseudomonas sp. zfem002]
MGFTIRVSQDQGAWGIQGEQKPIEWVGSSKEDLRAFPPVARQRAGYQLELIQDGEDPFDWKPMESVGAGVREIRIKCRDGAFRVFYVVNRPEALYVLHAFRKTTEKTAKCDIDVAKARFKSLG